MKDIKQLDGARNIEVFTRIKENQFHQSKSNSFGHSPEGKKKLDEECYQTNINFNDSLVENIMETGKETRKKKLKIPENVEKVGCTKERTNELKIGI